MHSELHWMFSSMERVVAGAGEGGDPAEVRAAFDRFLDKLRQTADLVDREGMPTSAVERADGFKNILIVLHFAMDRLFGEADPRAPAFGTPWPAHQFDWGAASPDSVYRSARLTGGVTYRISGHLGNSPSASLQFFDGGEICLTLRPEDLSQKPAGEVEVFVGGPKRDGAWFALPDGVTALLLRQFFPDWGAAQPARLRIEAIDSRAADWPKMSPDRITKELDALGEWVRLTTQFWADRLTTGFRDYPNGFTEFTMRPRIPAISWGFFDVQPGHAWIMEMPVPDSPYWSVQPGTIWWRTLDYANRHSSLNNSQTKIDADGMFRAVFSHEDPGVANWIDLQGVRNGAALVRIADPKGDLSTPTARVVPIGDLGRALPHAARVAPAARQAEIEERRRQITRLLLE